MEIKDAESGLDIEGNVYDDFCRWKAGTGILSKAGSRLMIYDH